MLNLIKHKTPANQQTQNFVSVFLCLHIPHYIQYNLKPKHDYQIPEP